MVVVVGHMIYCHKVNRDHQMTYGDILCYP